MNKQEAEDKALRLIQGYMDADDDTRALLNEAAELMEDRLDELNQMFDVACSVIARRCDSSPDEVKAIILRVCSTPSTMVPTGLGALIVADEARSKKLN